MTQAGRMLRLVALVALLAVTGCLGRGTPPLRYYTLTPVGSQSAVGATPDSAGPTILLMPVSMPGYLARQGVVTSSGSNVVTVADHHRWAEPLSDNFTRIFARNLSILVPSGNVLVFPARSGPADYAVNVDVLRFGGDLGREAVLEAIWTVKADDGRQDLGRYRAQYAEPTSDGSYEALVSAMSRTLEKFSRDVSDLIREEELPNGSEE